MKEIPDGSVDMILTDPPYGTVKGLFKDKDGVSKTEWDVVISHKEMLEECNRVLRPNGSLLLFSQDPYKR
jgi:site-specific DNA-methyltransferase (adenine-specific)